MSIRALLRTSLTARASLIMIAVVLARVVVRVGRRWLGDDFLGADAASMIVATLDGLVLVALGVVALGLRRAMVPPQTTTQTLVQTTTQTTTQTPKPPEPTT